MKFFTLSPCLASCSIGLVLSLLPCSTQAAPPIASPPATGSWQAIRVNPGDTETEGGGPAGAGKTKSDPARLVQVTSRSSGGLEERIGTFASGATRAIYRAKQATIAQTSPGNPFYFLLDRDNADADLLAEPGYFACFGVRPEHLAGEEVKFDIPCRRYDLDRIAEREGDFDAVPPRTVWVDAATNKPVAVRLGTDEFRFVISESDPGKPRPPAEVRKVWEAQKEALAVAFGKAAVEKTPFDL